MELDDLRAEMKAEFLDVRTEFREEFRDVRTEVRAEFKNVRTEFRGPRYENTVKHSRMRTARGSQKTMLGSELYAYRVASEQRNRRRRA